MNHLLLPLLPLADIPPPLPFQQASPWATYLVFLALTLLLELPLYGFVWKRRKPAVPWQRWVLAAAIANLLSHPVAAFLWRSIPDDSGTVLITAYVVLECAVAVFEAWFLRWRTKCGWRDAALAAGVANGVTALLGAWINFR